MKKFITGLVIGIGVTSATAAYASDTIQAFLFPADIVINGHVKNVDGKEYALLNYNGHAYVPVRYVAENMGAYVEYSEGSAFKRIGILHLEPTKPVLTDKNRPNIHVGNIDILQNRNQSVISGVIASDITGDNQAKILEFNLNFYNKDKALLGTARYEERTPETIQNGQIKQFTTALYGDVRSYDYMSLEVTKFTPEN
ncbi:hypothetical protein QFZ81_004021 [Paenibacillus sp. V4I9]|uniref:stalk domain-containing protein n=1 Tax=Paenibacillus sp. V4I9 TaxID=3042308 RepID=UPI0027805C8E|nr:stalk domain-containing protein [Paenibacillus sp. V4I9]MDQ0888933.1 hypothetical protein [Paenibacillus sp. V4I9]